jgi:hypothetical protein
MGRRSSSSYAAGSHARDFHESSRCCVRRCLPDRATATGMVNESDAFPPSVLPDMPAALMPTKLTLSLPCWTLFAQQRSQTKFGQVTT